MCTGLLALILYSCGQPHVNDQTLEAPEETVELKEVSKRYGIPDSSFKVHDGTIKRNQFLADILQNYGVPYQNIHALANVSKDVHDVRSLKAGDDYAVFCAKDSLKTPCYFVVETSPEDYVVYQLNDSIAAYIGQKPMEYRSRSASGEISSSLYQTIYDNKLPMSLANKLADIYAWTVDFYRIQKGDYFKVIYQEKLVDDEVVGIEKIMAAEFGHRDHKFVSFRFEGDSVANYFDEKGESLRKAFLKAPLDFSRISSRYSRKRYHPVQKRWKAHLGTDYAAPSGTPIKSTGDGEVIASRYSKYNGNYVKVRHNSTYTTQYLHMSRRNVSQGDYVAQGDIIGYVGSTGLATGPHVCYRFWKHGSQVDPYKQDLPPSEPVNPALMDEFKVVRDSLSKKLKNIHLKTEAV
jgi:murein DD-endopeptidase MepM/ murein hydrolase activator NlpD